MSVSLPLTGKRVPIQFGLLVMGFVVLVTMSLTSLWLARESDRASEIVAHTLEVNSAIVTYQGALRRAESGQRGFLLTGDRAYLNDYEAGRRRFDEIRPELERLISDNPEQMARLQALQPLVQRKIEEMEQTLAMKQAGRERELLASLQANTGLDTMNEMLSRISTMLNDERALLEDRREYSDRTSIMLFIVNFAGGLIIAVLALASISLIRKRSQQAAAALVQLEAAHAELATVNRSLEERVAERTADLREANDEIQRFAFIVSHDLRSPLVNVMGFTSEMEALQGEIFSETPQTPEQRAQQRREVEEALGFIKSSIAKMDRLINAILGLSRAGRREFTAQPIQLHQLLTAMSKDVAHRLQEVGGEIEIASLPEISSDRLAMEQIFSNLIDNAIKYRSNDRPVRISLDSEERGNFVVIRVSDNGRGIDQKDYERIFELFRRAGRQDRPGEGIGLAHVRAMVRRLGGTIRVDSELGQGTTFTIILPKKWTA
ncbi:GHKL domain-containing protein [Ferrovibrio terrae]|uniref:histidine kinase n=1 Tax=Ferrovibrio terrae TaxID=2594003 RepID=A0A516GX34_9PROT|nr:sensor histidine kinase [Ferrovibrio terrae]QDO96077.1 GHKL domain-containing protein [Ferrovibrio terrae]